MLQDPDQSKPKAGARELTRHCRHTAPDSLITQHDGVCKQSDLLGLARPHDRSGWSHDFRGGACDPSHLAGPWSRQRTRGGLPLGGDLLRLGRGPDRGHWLSNPTWGNWPRVHCRHISMITKQERGRTTHPRPRHLDMSSCHVGTDHRPSRQSHSTRDGSPDNVGRSAPTSSTGPVIRRSAIDYTQKEKLGGLAFTKIFHPR